MKFLGERFGYWQGMFAIVLYNLRDLVNDSLASVIP